MGKVKKKPSPKEVIELTKELFHGYFSGNLDPWFSHLCETASGLAAENPSYLAKRL